MKNKKKSPKKLDHGLSASAERANPMTELALLNKKQMCQLVGMSWSKVRSLIADGLFPKAKRLGWRTTLWSVDSLKAWIAEDMPRVGRPAAKKKSKKSNAA